MTPPPDLDADAFCLWIKEQIAIEGPAALFGLCGYLVLYSGPLDGFKTAREKLLGRDNKQRGREQAAQHGARILDDTPIGAWLIDQDWKVHFDAAYAGDDDLIAAAVSKVWATVSKELVKAAHGKAVTAACGADPDRVFCAHEVPQAVTETKLDTMNSLPVQLVQDFSKISIGEAVLLLAKFELLAWRTRARQAATPEEAAAARHEWRERHRLYKRGLAKARADAPAPTPEENAAIRTRRRAIRARYDFNAIKAAIRDDNQPRRTLLLTFTPAPPLAWKCH